MNVIETERCGVCGANAGEASAFCHFYPEGRRVTFCKRACAEIFLRGGAGRITDVGRRDYLKDLIAERNWASWR